MLTYCGPCNRFSAIKWGRYRQTWRSLPFFWDCYPKDGCHGRFGQLGALMKLDAPIISQWTTQRAGGKAHWTAGVPSAATHPGASNPAGAGRPRCEAMRSREFWSCQSNIKQHDWSWSLDSSKVFFYLRWKNNNNDNDKAVAGAEEENKRNKTKRMKRTR